MTPDLKHAYGLRAWIRMRLPWWAIQLGLAGKGKDCHFLGAAHRWYNIDDESSGCYYCQVVRSGHLWRRPAEPLHERDVVRIVKVKDSLPCGETLEHERLLRVGDSGIIVNTFAEDGLVLVENVAEEGDSVWWLQTFDHEELDVIECVHRTRAEI